MQVNYQAERPLGYQQATNVTSATGLNVPSGTSLILISCEGAAMRWRDDGTPPTASAGYPLAIGAELRYTAQGMGSLKLIPQSGTATINATYYGS